MKKPVYSKFANNFIFVHSVTDTLGSYILVTCGSCDHVLLSGLVPPQGVTEHFTVFCLNAVTRHILLMVKSLASTQTFTFAPLSTCSHNLDPGVFGPVLLRCQISNQMLLLPLLQFRKPCPSTLCKLKPELLLNRLRNLLY